MAVAESGEFVSLEGEHVDAIYMKASRIWLMECAKYLEQGGFAGTAGPDNTYDLLFLDMKVYAFEHLERAKRLMNSLKFNHGNYFLFLRCFTKK